MSSRVTSSATFRRSSGCARIIRCGRFAPGSTKFSRSFRRRFDKMYAKVGRPSIPPEQLLRALLLQMLYSVRSEQVLVEEVDYNILFRWFVGLNLDDPVWDATTFTKNRDRLLEAEVAK